MSRQATTPVSFNHTTRRDTAVVMTSGRAGVVVPVGYFPLLPGDSCSGSAGIDIDLAPMPKPLRNGVTANFQAWFVPKSAHPSFPGRDELLHAMSNLPIKQLGAADRAATPFFSSHTGATVTTVANSAFAKALGLHFPAGEWVNTDLIDAFVTAYNFRLAAHSSKLPLRKFFSQDVAEATSLPPAFWPSSRFAHVVPDYERALVVGALDLDVSAGQIPVKGISRAHNNTGTAAAAYYSNANDFVLGNGGNDVSFNINSALVSNIYADMIGQKIGTTLADFSMARTVQAFAKMRAAYAGNDHTGMQNDRTLVALLMRGIEVDADDFGRPWLLDSKRVPVGFAERMATDGAQLDKSITEGRASAKLQLNVPKQEVSGVVIITVEVLPERIDERMTDEWLHMRNFSDLPNALRDIQRVEPVDIVKNRRLDAKHATPNGMYGYEPMNSQWNRDFTRLGGAFYKPSVGAGWTENRATIWQAEIVNPAFTSTHFLAPSPFPHTVFSDTNGPAFEVVCRHGVSIVGLTQIGDVLMEANGNYAAVKTPVA